MEAAVRWSPHSTSDKQRFLIIGLSDHSVTLNHIDRQGRASVESHVVARQSNLAGIHAFDWSRHDDNIVVLGLKTGTANFLKLGEKGDAGQIIATYKPRQERKCNSVALSSDKWLAVGLDRTRADPACLNIFDANVDHQASPEPLRKLCFNEPVSSAKFFVKHSQEILVGVQRSLIRLYDLRDNSPNGLQVATNNTHNISIDPLDENYFVSGGSTNDPNITIWDKRWISQTVPGGTNNGAVFDFRPALDTSNATIWSLRYSGRRRGRIGICSSAGELRVIDTAERRETNHYTSSYLQINPENGSALSYEQYISRVHIVQRPYAEARDGPLAQSKLVAFDWIDNDHPLREQSMIALHPNGKVRLLHVPSTIPSANITPRNDLAMAYDDVSITSSKWTPEDAKLQGPYGQEISAEDFGPLDYTGEEDLLTFDGTSRKCGRDSPYIARILAPSMIQRERCLQGYLWDCHKNMEIVAGNWQLERLWEIIGRFKDQVMDNAMVAESLDLSYIGVAGLWLEDVKVGSHRLLSASSGTITDAIVGLNISRNLPAFEGHRTQFPEHRQLCLALCGWKFTTETLETECQELIERGLYYQAIVQAVLHGYKHIALNLLRTLIRSKTVANIGLNALLASDTINEEQREMCRWMAADSDDPALKALLTYLSTGDWRDVMRTDYLHSGYRVALGLKYLSDTELSTFIEDETARAVKEGDLEGILLTGLTEDAMDLMQTYIAKSNDLQTAVLATALTNPVYVDDMRWSMWKETYFEQMQSWRAFTQRVHFVVQHSQIARSRNGQSLITPPPSQVTLRCNHCQSTLARHDGRPLLFGEVRNQVAPANARVIGPAANAGIVCTKCGRHMPRCGICRMWLGAPDPARTHAAKETARDSSSIMAKFLTFCLRCGHGFHADHARAWFERHSVCAVPDCSCKCMIS